MLESGISMETRIVAPPRMRTWTRGEWHIYFDPHNFVWVKVNNSGRDLLELFRRHYTVPEAVEACAERYQIVPEAARTAIDSFTARLLASGFLHAGEYRERGPLPFPKVSFPITVYLHMTNRCNLRCSYCYNKTDRDAKIRMERNNDWQPVLSTAEYQAVISSLIEHGTRDLFFTGGEPLMRPDTLDLVEFARAKRPSLLLELLTNGCLITEALAERMCRSLDVVTISLDGHTAALHDTFRGTRSFEAAVRGIRTLLRTRNALGQKKPVVCSVALITRESVPWLKEIFEFNLENLAVDRLSPIIFQAGDSSAEALRLVPPLDEYTQAGERATAYLIECSAREQWPQVRSTPVVARNHCGAGFGELSIDPSGYVYPCQSLHFPEFVCGNVRDREIAEIYAESPALQRLRGNTVGCLPVCGQCDLRNLCSGGCRASAYTVYREASAHNELYCSYLESIAVNRLWGGTEMEISGSPR